MSATHVAFLLELSHADPTALHTGSVLQVHDADPAAPVQVWCWGLGHAVGVPYAQHPLPPSVQTASWPPTHDCCPCEQLSTHVVVQAAFGEVPEHDWVMVHVVIEPT
jgi:hypothetical protein